MNSFTFLHQFIRHPIQTGAILSSGSRLCRVLTHGAKVSHAQVILEFGTGNGKVTETICHQKSGDATLIGLEINKVFAEATTKRCPNVEVVNGCATQAKSILYQKKLDYCDSIVSSLPWTVFSDHEQDRILSAAIEVLRPGGMFVTFIYLHRLPLKSTKRFCDKLTLAFQQVSRSQVVWVNMPPAVAYIAIK